jgi:hypothetical protein
VGFHQFWIFLKFTKLSNSRIIHGGKTAPSDSAFFTIVKISKYWIPHIFTYALAYKTIPLFPIEFPNSINGDKSAPTASPMNENPSSKRTTAKYNLFWLLLLNGKNHRNPAMCWIGMRCVLLSYTCVYCLMTFPDSKVEVIVGIIQEWSLGCFDAITISETTLFFYKEAKSVL